MVMNIVKTYQMIKKNLFRVEKNIIKREKTIYYNYKKILETSFRKSGLLFPSIFKRL